jgi:signal transduction histidine kinase
MYIGMREPKTFSPRERRRIEAIGESLALLIENAQLHGALEQQLEEVRAEQKLRDVLVSIIAHDLRGPVGTAKFAAELLGRSKDEQAGPASLQGRTALIIRNLDRADRMVQDLLDAQRLQVGKRLDVARVPCDLSAIVREVVGDLSEQHRDRFLLDAPAEPLEGQWGANELRRAIWNLASNALKYGSPDTPVRIAMRRLPDGAEIAVHNEGRPVPTEDQATLFEPFARARNGHASPQGWGLGLTIVRGVAEAHDGSVEVDSAPGRGTTFTLRVRSA